MQRYQATAFLPSREAQPGAVISLAIHLPYLTREIKQSHELLIKANLHRSHTVTWLIFAHSIDAPFVGRSCPGLGLFAPGPAPGQPAPPNPLVQPENKGDAGKASSPVPSSEPERSVLHRLRALRPPCEARTPRAELGPVQQPPPGPRRGSVF